MPVELGAMIPFATEVENSSGTAVDATTVLLVVTQPDGTLAGSYSLALGTVSHPAVGNYTRDQPGTTAGLWTGRWVTTNPDSATVQTFHVEDDIGPLVSLSDIKSHLRQDGTRWDEVLSWLGDVASDACETYTGRAFRRRTVTDTFSDYGFRSLALSRAPVVSVTSVTESGVTADATGYSVNPRAGVVTRHSGTFGNFPNSVVVTYIVGQTGAIPGDIRIGVLDMVKHLFEQYRGNSNAPRSGPGQTEWVPGQNDQVPRRVREAWARYRAPGFA